MVFFFRHAARHRRDEKRENIRTMGERLRRTIHVEPGDRRVITKVKRMASAIGRAGMRPVQDEDTSTHPATSTRFSVFALTIRHNR